EGQSAVSHPPNSLHKIALQREAAHLALNVLANALDAPQPRQALKYAIGRGAMRQIDKGDEPGDATIGSAESFEKLGFAFCLTRSDVAFDNDALFDRQIANGCRVVRRPEASLERGERAEPRIVQRSRFPEMDVRIDDRKIHDAGHGDDDRMLMSVAESFRPPRSQTVEGDGEHDNGADHDLLDVIRPTHLLAAIAQKRHDQRADHRADDGPL